MRIEAGGYDTFVSTGGREFDPGGAGGQPPLLFIHGSGQSHLSWVLQGRFFANRGWPVLAPDLPGHGLSGGESLESVEAAADWCRDLLDAAGVEKAVAIGHSQGGLVALEMAARHAGRVERLAIIASALAIQVADGLIDMATNAEADAIAAMVSYSHSRIGHRHDHTTPGQSHMIYGERVMKQNRKGVLLVDLNACRNYTGGEKAAAAVACPALCVLAEGDRMVPARSGLQLAEKIPGCRHIVVPGAGHFVQSEFSVETNAALRPFFLGSE